MKKNEKKDILLAYGSEFGNAYDCCRTIFYELYLNFQVDFFCLNEIDLLNFYKYNNIILIVSTTGYGNCPHNMFHFWVSLCNAKNMCFFENMYFHIFGLGDSAYDNYNSVVKKLKKKLNQLEANIVNYSLGNYQHPCMHYTNFNLWKKKVYDFLRVGKESGFPLDINHEIPNIFTLYNHEKNTFWWPSKEKKEIIKEKEELKKKYWEYIKYDNYVNYERDNHFCENGNFLKMEIIKNERVTEDSYFQDVRRIDLKNIEQSNEYLHVGSLIKIHPFLNVEKTKRTLHILNINYNKEIIIKSDYINDKNSNWFIPLNQKIKVLDLFVHFIDLNKIVTPLFFYYLSKKTNSEIHKKKFLQLSDTDNISEYLTYIIEDKRSYYDIFDDFYYYINVDINFLINTLPHIQTRTYSILNSSKPFDSLYNLKNNLYFFKICRTLSYPFFSSFMQILIKRIKKNHKKKRSSNDKGKLASDEESSKIELLVCLYEIEVNKNRKLKGLCSQYLTELKPGNFIYARIDNGLIYLNKNILNPNYRIVYISTGAAISSILSVMRRRYNLYREHGTESYYLQKKDVSFLGHRQKKNDFYFQEELKTYLSFNLVFIAFSRDTENFCFLNKDKEDIISPKDIKGSTKEVDQNKKLNSPNERKTQKTENKNESMEEMLDEDIKYSEIKQAKEILNKKKIYVTDIIIALQHFVYNLLKNENTIFLIAGKSRPFSQNLIKEFAKIIKKNEQHKTDEEINTFLKKKIDNFSIILESWY